MEDSAAPSEAPPSAAAGIESLSISSEAQPSSSAAPMSGEERFKIVRSVGVECIQEDELLNLLTKKPQPICYDGFEPSGRMHIAQTVRLTHDLAVPYSGAGHVLYSETVRLLRRDGDPAPASFSIFFSFSVTNLNPASIGVRLAFLNSQTSSETDPIIAYTSTVDDIDKGETPVRAASCRFRQID